MKLILRGVLKGVPASQGLAVGQVVRVEDGVPIRDVKRGTAVVLVAATASPRLRSLVADDDGTSGVSGIIVERGGALCTMATVARELALPAVFGAIDALSVVHDGELILLDGGTGWVYRLDAAGPPDGETSLPRSLTMWSVA